MRSRYAGLLLFVAVLIGGCDEPGSVLVAGPDYAAGGSLTFTDSIKPVAEVQCKRCHGQQMSDYATITAKKWVVPGEPEQSRYYMKPSGRARHSGGKAWKDKADLVRRWIAAGAPK